MLTAALINARKTADQTEQIAQYKIVQEQMAKDLMFVFWTHDLQSIAYTQQDPRAERLQAARRLHRADPDRAADLRGLEELNPARPTRQSADAVEHAAGAEALARADRRLTLPSTIGGVDRRHARRPPPATTTTGATDRDLAGPSGLPQVAERLAASS